MSSNEDMFDLSDTCDESLFQTQESPIPPTPTPPTPTPPTPTPPASSPTPPTPTPPAYNPPTQEMLSTDNAAEGLPSQSFEQLLNCDLKMPGISECSQIRLEFLDSDGNKVSPTRYTDNLEMIKIMKSLIKSENPRYRNSAAATIASSDLLKDNIKQQVLSSISQKFSDFLSRDDCPLKDLSLFKNVETMEKIDIESIFDQCTRKAGDLLKSLSVVCFGVEDMDEMVTNNLKHEKQRLLAILSISAITRNRSVNVVQKILGEFFKLKNANRQVLQLLQRMGLSLVSVAIRSDMDSISKHFMTDVKKRKLEIEQWAQEREMLENEVKAEIIKNAQSPKSHHTGRKLRVEYTPNELIVPMVDLGEIELVHPTTDLAPTTQVLQMIHAHGSAQTALDDHLDNCPAAFTITYDNIDIGVAPNEYVADVTKDQSLHWCSSIVVEDVVLGNELIDQNSDRAEKVDFDNLVKLTTAEKHHLLVNYTKLVINLLVKTWPNCFPELKSEKITHQYTSKFEAGVKSYTGPLVCETESTLEGISTVIKTLVDVVCPSKVRESGVKEPLYPTTFRYRFFLSQLRFFSTFILFSGDNKTEKAARSAQVALVDNGDMTDTLGFIEGKDIYF